MRRMLHPNLMRGPFAQRAAILLLMGLLVVLAASVLHGVGLLGGLTVLREPARMHFAESCQPVEGLLEFYADVEPASLLLGNRWPRRAAGNPPAQS